MNIYPCRENILMQEKETNKKLIKQTFSIHYHWIMILVNMGPKLNFKICGFNYLEVAGESLLQKQTKHIKLYWVILFNFLIIQMNKVNYT